MSVMHTSTPSSRSRVIGWGIAVALLAAQSVSAQGRVVLPAGSVILVRTTSPLQSDVARNGQSFETNVEESVGVDEYTIIPAGSKIRGTMTTVRPATRQQSGVIEVAFDRLTLSDGSVVPINGKLTSTDSVERRQIESDPNMRVMLIGGRGGIGAAIAGASGSRSSNNIFAALGSMLSEGRDVNVPAGTALAVKIETPVTLRGRGRLRGGEASTIYTAAERIRAAQEALAQQRYYRGPVNGQLTDATRRALFQYQVDKGLSGTGNLDGRTARSLGLNLAGSIGGATLTAEQASAIRRDAQSLVARLRSELGASSVGQLSSSRAYAQGDLELWFALSAMADNAALYEQIVRSGGNGDAAVLAGRALVSTARRVDAAVQATRASSTLQSGWSGIRQQLTTLESSGSPN